MTPHEPDGVLHRIRLCTKFSRQYPLFVAAILFQLPKPDPSPLTYTRQLRESAEGRQSKSAGGASFVQAVMKGHQQMQTPAPEKHLGDPQCGGRGLFHSAALLEGMRIIGHCRKCNLIFLFSMHSLELNMDKTSPCREKRSDILNSDFQPLASLFAQALRQFPFDLLQLGGKKEVRCIKGG